MYSAKGHTSPLLPSLLDTGNTLPLPFLLLCDSKPTFGLGQIFYE